MTPRLSVSIEVWIKGLAAAAISGAANGVITGFAAVGIDPMRFNLQSGIKPTLTLASASALMSSLIGASAYLKQSPLPPQDLPSDFDDVRSHDDARSRNDVRSHDDVGAREDAGWRDSARSHDDVAARDDSADRVRHDDARPGDRPR